jgi:hypothetical protein
MWKAGARGKLVSALGVEGNLARMRQLGLDQEA